LACQARTFLPGKVLIQEGTKNNDLFLIISGECKFYSDNDPSHIRITDDGRIARVKQAIPSNPGLPPFSRKQH
jgi:CRP-like cAMP-binding protein